MNTQAILDTTARLAQIAQQFANIASGHPEYNQHGNAWKIPADGWTL